LWELWLVGSDRPGQRSGLNGLDVDASLRGLGYEDIPYAGVSEPLGSSRKISFKGGAIEVRIVLFDASEIDRRHDEDTSWATDGPSDLKLRGHLTSSP
jgi:hypothetical protein